MYLLDTDALSRMGQPGMAPGLSAWIDGVADRDIWLSSITIGELSRAVALHQGRDADLAEDFDAWLGVLMRAYASRILPFGRAEAAIWGDLTARLGHASSGLMVSATALTNDLTVVTCQPERHQQTGVRVLNPEDERLFQTG